MIACLRTLDCLRLAEGLAERDIAEPLLVSLGTLDAIHLATALEWSEFSGTTLALATHDARLAMAARALGLATIGT